MYSSQKASKKDAMRTELEKESRVGANVFAGHSTEPNLAGDLGADGVGVGAWATTPPDVARR